MPLSQRKVYATRSQTKLLRELQIQREGRQEAVNELQTLPKAASGSDKRVPRSKPSRSRLKRKSAHLSDTTKQQQHTPVSTEASVKAEHTADAENVPSNVRCFQRVVQAKSSSRSQTRAGCTKPKPKRARKTTTAKIAATAKPKAKPQSPADERFAARGKVGATTRIDQVSQCILSQRKPNLESNDTTSVAAQVTHCKIALEDSESITNSDQTDGEASVSSHVESLSFNPRKLLQFPKVGALTKGASSPITKEPEACCSHTVSNGKGEPDSWTKEQEQALKAAQKAIPLTHREYWMEVATRVGGKTAEQCFLHFHDCNSQKNGQRKAKPRASKKPSLLSTPNLMNSRAGTLKRKADIRHMLSKLDEGHRDDLFDAGHDSKDNSQALDVSIDDEDFRDIYDNSSSTFCTPKPRRALPPVADPSPVVESPHLLVAVDNAAVDRYISKVQKAPKRMKPCLLLPPMQEAFVPGSGSAITEGHVLDKLVSATDDEEDDEECQQDYYFSDSD